MGENIVYASCMYIKLDNNCYNNILVSFNLQIVVFLSLLDTFQKHLNQTSTFVLGS